MPTRPAAFRVLIPVILLGLLLIAACAPADQTAQNPPALPTILPVEPAVGHVFPASAVPYPAHYRARFQRFLTVDRPDATVRDLYIDPDALAALRQGQPLPENTIIVIETYHAQVDADGQPIRSPDGQYLKGDSFEMLHVAQRRSDWSDADIPSEVHTGKWNFGSFDVQTGAPFDEDLAACFNCHQAMFETDFLYTAPDLLRYVQTGQPQYQFCNLRRRVPC